MTSVVTLRLRLSGILLLSMFDALFFECVMLSGVSKLVGGKQGVRMESIMTSPWFWIVHGAALLTRLAQSFSIFPRSPQ